jgi:SAM-dependent methyltransferase
MRPAEVRFDPGRLALIAATEERHFWHAPRRTLLRRLVRDALRGSAAPVLDIGCGTGALVRALREDGIGAHGVDAFAARHGLPAEGLHAGTVDALPFDDASFGLVGLFDVLEHVEEAPALREAARVLQPGGTLLVTVPAYRWLWGPRDEVAGHLRRYHRAQLVDVLSTAGFRVERVFGYQAALLPLLLWQRLRSRRRGATAVAREDSPLPLINAMLRGINAAEVRLPAPLRPPFGSSLVAIAHRPA